VEQQTATAEILRVISSSPGALQPVFEAILENATRICEAKFGNLWLREGDKFRIVALYGGSPEYREYLFAEPLVVPDAQSAMGRIANNREVVQIDDISKAPSHSMRMRIATIKIAKARTLVGVPMLKENEVVGIIGIYRQEVRSFSDKQIELVQNFAAQAVIAIENARLLNELKESLEQQTATSDVLQVISSSPGELERVFTAMLANATRICEAQFGNFMLREGSTFRAVAWHGEPTYVEKLQREPLITISDDTRAPLARLIETKEPVHVADLRSEPAYKASSFAPLVTLIDSGGARTLLLVPMLKDNALVGAISIYRREVRPFSDKQIELVQNFANQAVIAIENTRLLNELRQRTADLTESLEQQTATSEVLQVISSSPGDLEPVFATMLENAVRICDAKFGNIYRRDGDRFQLVSTHNAPPGYAEARRRLPHHGLNPGTLLGRMAAVKTVVHVADASAERGYIEERLPETVLAVELGGLRTALAVPMLRESELIGGFSLCRQEVRPFTEKQIELVMNFAAQAVIAIENAQLLNELRQSLQRQTATSEVLQVISGSPGELEPVFATMLEKAVRICDAKFGCLYLHENGLLRLVAAHDVPEFFEARRGIAFEAVPGGPLEETMRSRRTIQIADLAATKAYIERHPLMVESVELAGARTAVAVPMLKEGELIGIVSIHRREVLPFTDKQIELLTNFAAQAVIAIENARLLSELRESLQEQTATSEVLQVISRSPGNIQTVFSTVLENAVRVCEAKFGLLYLYEHGGFRSVAARDVPPAFAEALGREQFPPAPGGVLDAVLKTGRTAHVSDLAAMQGYLERHPRMVDGVELGGIRTVVAVPMLRGDVLVGVIAIYRQEVRPFTEKQIALLTNFAAQAVIAIENARLLNELRERTGQLEMQSQEVVELNQQLEQRVADQVGEIERMGRLRRFLPPQVADLIVASGTEKQLESHRREIAALFCDLRGFTGFTEIADAEDVMALLRDYHAAIGEIIIKYSGTLERYAGDGVMVIFNDPVLVENPALQAVLMALEMRDAIGALTEKWRQLGHEIGFGIGIAHGYATLGTIGFEGRFDYAAIGTVSNVASRLCDEAKPGQILVSPRVLMAVKDAVAVEAVGEFELKGIRRPIAAHNVLAALSPSP
jgi:GAF domain-containing protein